MKNIFAKSLGWYLFDVTKEILKGWRNFLVFNFHYFSIGLLFKTLLSPWKRYRYSYGRGFSPKRYINIWVFNMMSRIIGAISRIGLIIFGVLAEIFIFFSGLAVLLVWIFLPLISLTGFILGFKLIFF